MSFLERSQAWKESVNLHDRKLVAYAKDEVSTTGAMEGDAAGVKLFDDAAAEMPISCERLERESLTSGSK